MDTISIRASFDYIRKDNQLMYSVVLLDTETKKELTLLCKAKNNQVPSWVGMKQGQLLDITYHVTEGGNFVLDAAQKVEDEPIC